MRVPDKVSSARDILFIANSAIGSAERRTYIVKNMIKGEFDYQLTLQKSLSAFPKCEKLLIPSRSLRC